MIQLVVFHIYRFLDLPAQVVRCILDDVYPPRMPDGSRGSSYPDETFKFLRGIRFKPAVAFFSKWLVAKEGHIHVKPSFELPSVLAIL